MTQYYYNIDSKQLNDNNNINELHLELDNQKKPVLVDLLLQLKMGDSIVCDDLDSFSGSLNESIPLINHIISSGASIQFSKQGLELTNNSESQEQLRQLSAAAKVEDLLAKLTVH
ncbi:recombinase family protein [Vibrio sp. SS-MA-C1-2]|uniref:recombinase family protein n=1 Tax=Vibrio sp. SS-MA-C1-2 TaxID=2908646 RepID=UPI001F226744|nr:recombinase family protein [Vibrio sp. SS-MA-C1-2]UJF17265.1 recombinase family protein [Vibrio sp. SS-MA-C1-2]